MAYVVVRPRGRFEIRESVYTPNGPRARSLANFATLTDEVLERASRRATRPFDVDAVRRAVRKATATVPPHAQPETRRFVEATRRMARSLDQLPEPAARRDPGDAFIDLIGVVANVAAFGPTRPLEPLRYPPLARLRAARGDSGHAGVREG